MTITLKLAGEHTGECRLLAIETFANGRGGNVLYKALAHPLAAAALSRLASDAAHRGGIALYDPASIADALLALSPAFPVRAIYSHDILDVGSRRAGHVVRPLTELAASDVSCVLIAAFDAERQRERLAALVPASMQVLTLDSLRLPTALITRPQHYLDPLNFATNFAFFRDDDHLGTRLFGANYWFGYGATRMRLHLRLYDGAGELLASWEHALPAAAGGWSIDSGEVRRRFGLPAFTGQLFLHAVGVCGHDIVKYALDVYATDGGASLSCTHDANAWPAERYAGLPAPADGERVILWLQNSHACPIPAGAITLARMGTQAAVAIEMELAPFATRAIDVSHHLPEVRWPSQLELRAGRYVVRPRYEVTRARRSRIAHLNVERTDLGNDARIPALPRTLGRGYLLPFPLLPREHFRTILQPTPMAVAESGTPLRLDVFDADGHLLAQPFIGVLPRCHARAIDLDTLLEPGLLQRAGHAELVYDFRAGGEANGWLHALFRYEHRRSGHIAECSFGAHLFNTLMTYQDEPQSYRGPPPGLSTRLYLRLGSANCDSFCRLIYPASLRWHPRSTTRLELCSTQGEVLESRQVEIACHGSMLLRPSNVFGGERLRQAGDGGYVLVRDATCRLFGYHGQADSTGRFSFDHMFGF